MNRDGVARMALTVYPADVRGARGEEMVATLLDATDGRRLAGFTRELGGLVGAGLRVRATDTARVGPARLIADGACLAAAWILTRELATLLGQRVRGEHDALLAPWTVALAAVVLALVLIGHDRLGGIGALLWTATRTPALLHDVSASTVLLAAIVPVLCFTVLIVTPRRRATDLRRLAWLALPIALAAALGPPPWEQNPVLIAAVWLGVLATLAAALVLLPTDPRLALAGALSLSDVALRGLATHPTTPAAFAVAAAGPAAAAVVVLRTRRLQRRAAGAV